MEKHLLVQKVPVMGLTMLKKTKENAHGYKISNESQQTSACSIDISKYIIQFQSETQGVAEITDDPPSPNEILPYVDDEIKLLQGFPCMGLRSLNTEPNKLKCDKNESKEIAEENNAPRGVEKSADSGRNTGIKAKTGLLRSLYLKRYNLRATNVPREKQQKVQLVSYKLKKNNAGPRTNL